jgi:hypothetical protein
MCVKSFTVWNKRAGIMMILDPKTGQQVQLPLPPTLPERPGRVGAWNLTRLQGIGPVRQSA